MLNHLLQDHAAGFEVAAGRGLGVGGHGFAAHIVRPMLMHRRAALGACAQVFSVAKLHDLAALGVFVVAKVKLQLPVLFFFVELERNFGGERPTGFGAETFQGTNLFVAQEMLHLFQLEGATRRCFAKREAAARAFDLPVGIGLGDSTGQSDAGVAAVVFFHHTAAGGAGGGEGGVVARDGVAVVLFGFFHHAPGHLGDVLHEGFARQQAFFHLREFELPVAGQVGA